MISDVERVKIQTFMLCCIFSSQENVVVISFI